MSLTLHDLDLLYTQLAKRTDEPGVWDAFSKRFVVPGQTDFTFFEDANLTKVAHRFVLTDGKWVEAEVPTPAAEPDEG